MSRRINFKLENDNEVILMIYLYNLKIENRVLLILKPV